MLPLILLQTLQGWVEACAFITKKALQYYIHMPHNTNYFHLTHHLLRSKGIEVTNVLFQIHPLSTSWGCLSHAAAREGDVKVKSGKRRWRWWARNRKGCVSSSTSWRCCHMLSLCQVHFCMWIFWLIQNPFQINSPRKDVPRIHLLMLPDKRPFQTTGPSSVPPLPS